MSKCVTKLPASRRMTWNTLVKLTSPTVSANLTSDGAGVQARGILRASSLWIHLKCYSYEGLQADVTTGICSGPGFCLQVFAFGELGALPLSAWWQA